MQVSCRQETRWWNAKISIFADSKTSCETEYQNGLVQQLTRLEEKEEEEEEEEARKGTSRALGVAVSGLNLARPASQKSFAWGYCET